MKLKKGQTFQEFTLVIPAPYTEIIVQIICETGKIYRIYCYADSIPTIENDETGKEYKIQTESGLNPLFLNIMNPTKVFKMLILHTGAIFITSEGSDEAEEYNREVEILEKALQVHDIPKDIDRK